MWLTTLKVDLLNKKNVSIIEDEKARFTIQKPLEVVVVSYDIYSVKKNEEDEHSDNFQTLLKEKKTCLKKPKK